MSEQREPVREQASMPLLDHLVELRRRLMYAIMAFLIAFVVCYHFAGDIFAFLVRPLAELTGEDSNSKIIYTALTEAFFTHVKIGYYAALFLSFPVIASQLWMFVAPGLYRHEKRAFFPFLFATPVLFALGAALAYYLIFPLAWKFFLSFQTPGGEGSLPVELVPKVSEYLSLVLSLTFAFGLAFQLPVLLMLLARVGLLTAAKLVRWRRYAVVLNFVVAAVITPPDVISQVSLAVPLILLYEISIIAVRMMERARAGRDSASAV